MSYSEFYQRSITQPESFWAEQAQRIDWQQPYTQVLDHSNPPFARWFCGGTTNLCHNAIDRWLEKQPDALALIAVSSETEEERTFTFRQLYDEVNVAAAMLLSLGVQRGDRVLVYMPMIAEAHITLLACARIGAIHSVVFGGFASHSVAARIDDARPVVIVSADAGRAGARSCRIKSCSMMRSNRRSTDRVMWCWSIAVWRKWRGSRDVTSTLPPCANSISARGTSCLAGIKRNILHSLYLRDNR